MPLGDPAPKPPSLLGYHRPLSPTAAVRVSPLCLGTMNFGSAWREKMGDCAKDEAFQIMDRFYGLGGNFIDTANFYQAGESEQWIGEWMQARGNRDQLVLATKYTATYAPNTPLPSNTTGNSLKSLHRSIASSLRNLQTDYIDLLYSTTGTLPPPFPR